MFTPTKIAFLISALVAGSAFAASGAPTQATSEPIAREAAGDVRGEGGKKAGHPAIEVKDQLARRGQAETSGEGAGHPAIEVKDQLARRGQAETSGEGAGHPAIEVKDQLARRGADDRQPDDRGGLRGGRGGSA